MSAPATPLDPVLAACRASILDVGLRRTTFAEVARRAGVSRMTLYRQYPDLDAVVTTLLTHELVGLIEDARDRAAHLPTARERLVEAAVLCVAALARDALLRRVLELDPELLLPLIVDRLGSSQRAAVELVAEQVAAGHADGSVRNVDPHLAATCVLLTTQSFVLSARVLETEHPTADVGEQLRRLLDGYLR